MTSLGTHPTATAVLHAAEQLADVAWEDLDAVGLLESTAALARVKCLVDGALVQLADRLEASGAAERVGWADAKDFLTHVTGGRKGSGGGLVRVAKKTRRLAEVRAALVAGEISLAQAGVIGTRVSTLPQAQEFREQAAEKMLQLVDQEGLDATDLDRAFPRVVRDLDPDGSLLSADLEKERAERGAHHARYLTFTPDTLGGVRIKGYATIEDVELVKTTLVPLSAPVTTEPGACGGDPDPGRYQLDDNGHRKTRGCPDPECGHTGRDPREAGARLWDALVEACRRLQATDSVPHAHGTTARIIVTVGLDQLTDPRDGHLVDGGLLPSGDRLSTAAVRKLACDADIIPAVLGTDGEILDLGRSQRLVTRPLWTALVLRDRHCAFPGCTRPPIACDAHHVQHWADGGSTSLDNLVLLCRKHHTVTHHTPWHVAIDSRTRRPVWTPPPPADLRTHHPPPRPPLVA